MVAAVALQSQTQPKNEQFYKLTLEALRQDYKAKVLNAETYVYYLIKAKNATGWKWHVNVKEFCAEWKIPQRSFYRALSKLRAKNLIFWRPGDNTIILWWDKEVTEIANVYSNDSANRPKPDIVMAPPDMAKPLQDVAEQNAQTLAVVESYNPSYSLHIDLEKHTDSKEEVCVLSEKLLDQDPECGKHCNLDDETNQDPIPGSRTTLLDDAKTLQIVDTTSHEDQGSAAPIYDTELICNAETLPVANTTSHEGRGLAAPVRKTSQKQEWVCPGTEEEKKEFFIFKAKLLVAAGQCKEVQARAMAISWADHKPKAADALWEDWQREKAKDANRSTAIKTVPEFKKMDKQEHAEVLEKFINHTKQEFLNLCWWHEYWLEFACFQFRVGKQLVPGLTAEIIKQIKAY